VQDDEIESEMSGGTAGDDDDDITVEVCTPSAHFEV